MIYEIWGSYQYPDIPTEQLVDVPLFYSKGILTPFRINKERPVFNASDLEVVSINIIEELQQIEEEIEKKCTKKGIDDFPLLKEKLNAYLKDNPKYMKNRVFKDFLEDVQHEFLFMLSLFSYKNYPFVLDNVFREHFFEYRFISYLSSYFYYESVRFDKTIRDRNMKESAVLDAPIEDGLTMKDTISMPVQESSSVNRDNIENLFTNTLLVKSFESLPSQQQTILFHYYVEGYKDREIAQKLGVSQQAISKSKRKAINQLKKIMKGG